MSKTMKKILTTNPLTQLPLMALLPARGEKVAGGRMRGVLPLVALLLFVATSALAQTEVLYRDDFQAYKTPSNPTGWIDTSVGTPKPTAAGLYKAWPDPLQGNQGTNVVYGTKQSSGKPEGNNPRIGTFSTLTTKTFNAKGRFEYQGRLIRTNSDSRIGLTFLSSYPEQDKYYLLGLWSQGTTTKLTMQLFGFGAGTLQGTIDSNVVIDPNRWYRFLVQVDDVDNTTKIRARFWPDGTPEPTTFAIDATDAAATRLTTGRIGMWAAVKGDAYIDDLFAKSPVDHTPPTIVFADADTGAILNPATLALFKKPARIEIRVTDDLSSVTTTAKLDGTTDYASATPITVDGLHKITVHAVDGPGNAADASLDLLVDQVPPLITLQINGATFASGAIFNDDVTLNAVIQDISTTDSTATLNGNIVTLPKPIAEERAHDISVSATDQVGWQSTAASSFIVDKTPPVVKIFANGNELGGGESFQADVTLTWTATDLTLDRVEATLNGAPITSGTVVNAERIHDLVVKAYDKATHSTTETRRFVLDKTAPEVRLLANGETFKPGTTFKAPVRFTVEVNDSTPTTEAATIDDQTYNLGAAYGTEGPHTIKVIVTNAANLSTTIGPAPFTIDLTPPTITLTESGQPFTNGMKFNRDVNPVVTASDNLTANPERVLTLNGQSYPLDTPISEEKAEHVISATATDDGGNSTSVGPFRFLLDKTKPVVTIVEAETGEPFGADALFGRPVRAKITVADLTRITAVATLNGAAFNLGAPQTQADGSVVFVSEPVSTDGQFTVSVVATDEVEWKNDPVTASFTIDMTAPALTFTSHQNDQTVTGGDVMIAGGSDDSIVVRVDGVEAMLDTTAKTFSIGRTLLEGANTITASGTDKAGNTGTATLKLNLDTRSPELTVDAVAACTRAESIELRGTVSDPRLLKVIVKIGTTTINGTVAQGRWSATVPLGGEGAKSILIEASDSVQHSATKQVSLTVDRTSPAIEIRSGGAPFTTDLVGRAVSLFVSANDVDTNPTITATVDGTAYASGAEIAAEGSHTIRVTAKDCAGNEASREHAFAIDLTAPQFLSFNPPSGTKQTTVPAALTGTVSADAVQVRANGITVPASNGAFSIPNILSEGINELALEVTDRAGHTGTGSYTLGIRTNKPLVEIAEGGAAMVDGTVYRRTVEPRVRVFEEGVTFTATLNGNAFTNGTQVTENGAYTISATATDPEYNQTNTITRTFTIDRSGPTVTIVSPSNGAVIDADRVDVRVNAGDSIRVTVNSIVAVKGGDNLWTANVPLEIGDNVLNATGEDAAGNSGSDSKEVTRGSAGPAIVLTFPPNDYVTNRPKLDVTGRVLRPNSSVAVTVPPAAAASTAVDPAGMFRLPGATLTEGEFVITATATEGGKSTSATARVIADFTPPRVRILESNQTLEDGAQFGTQAVLSGEAIDKNQAVNYQLVIDGNTVTPPVTITANGGHTAIITARDAAGNESRLERTFYIGSGGGGGCLLDEESFDPRDNSVVNGQKIELVGRSGGAAGVKVNGIAAKMSNGSFCASVELPQEGANEVSIVCTDADGNPTGQPKTITLYRVTNDPSVTITTPVEDSVTHDETIVVTGTLGNGAVSVDLNSKPATINGSNWTVTDVRLQDGVNVLVARAKNAAGKTAVASRRITYIQDPPAISISSPLAGFVTGSATVDVSGTYSNVVPSSLAIAGQAGAVEATPWSDTTGQFIARNVTLNTGDNTIAVTGSDRTGRVARAEVPVRYLVNTPLISITSPADNHYFPSSEGNEFTVSGTFSGAEGTTVDVNGISATLSGATFSAEVPFSTIAGGMTPVIARVTQPGSDGAFDSIRVFKLSEGPRVLETFPAADAVEVDPGATVLVLFSAPMDRASTVDAFRLENMAGTAISGKAYLDKDVLTFAPAATLTPGERYTIKVSTAAKDLADQPLTAAVANSFFVATTAPTTAPTLTSAYGRFCGNLYEVTGTTVPGARVRLDYGTIFFTTTASATGAFSYKIPLSGQQGYHVIRVRTVGADGTFSPFVELKLNVDCAGPRVLDAQYDRATNKITIVFSREVKASTVNNDTVQLVLSDARVIGGTMSVTGANATVTPAENLSEQTFTLKVSTGVEDLAGLRLEAPFTKLFSFGTEEPQPGDGRGYITGEVYDATTGRPLAGASITIEAPTAAFLRGPQSNNVSSQAAVTMTTDARGRYGDRFPEGAHTIRASADGYTTVWRQIIVPAGAGVIPIDIRLTKRGAPSTVNGAATLTHGGDKIARRAELTIPAGAVTAGASVTLTATGAQSLAGLLPLGWSPLASAEILTNALTLGASTLTFDVPQSEITTASQSLAAVRYDDSRDEWRVVAAVVNVNSGKATFEATAPGAYALVYADKAPLQVPPAPVTGSPLQGVDDPCAAGTCPELVATSFPLDPAVVLPTESTVATLNIQGTAPPHVYPSGTAVQAYIDEELRLVDGGRELDPPFATDLLLYRNLKGDTGVASFRLAPSARAAEVTLEVGFDHIRILAYPGRLDRGTLIGPEGGRVPADDKVAVEIPTGATQAELHASATSLSDPQSFGPIAGYTIVGGLQLNLAAANQTPTDLDGDGQPEPAAPVQLTRAARATFTVPAQPAGAQLILVELLDRTPFGNRMYRLAAEMQSIDATRWTTKSIDRDQLPVDGIIREGRYLLLSANAPIAFAKGIVRLGAGGPAAADARVSTPTLAVADLSRITGIFNVPVPTANFQLIPRSANLGDGATYTHPSAPAAGAIVNVGDLLIVAQPPQVASTIPSANATNVSLTTTVEVTFTPGIDPSSVSAGSLSVIDTASGNTLPGTVTAVGNLGIRWAMPSGEALRQGTRYAVTVASSVRGINGTPLGQAYAFTFTTVAVVSNNEVHPERIRITIPDANGHSRIIGDAGALKAGWIAVPTRRGNDFRTRYSATAGTDGGFSLTIGNGADASDRLTIADEIDLRVLNNAGALAAIIPLTPFTSEDGKSFVAPKRTAVTFTSVEGIKVSVPATAFDVATLVEVTKVQPSVFAEVPRVFDELDIVGAVEVKFEGRARERLQITIPVPPSVTPANGKFFLGWLGMSTRGPRIQAQDELFAANGALTTTRPASGGSNLSARMVAGNSHGVTRGNGPGDMLEGMIEAGMFAATQFKEGTMTNGFVWALLGTHGTIMELHWDTLYSLWVGHRYVAEHGTVIFPVPAGRPFRVTGIDPATSLTLMDQPFNALPIGAPGEVAVLPTPQNDLNGPHPVYASPNRIETAEAPPVDVEVESVRNVKMKLSSGGSLSLTPGTPFTTSTRVFALDVQTGERVGPQTLPMSLSNVKAGHRIVLAFEEHDVDPSTPVSVVFNEPIDLGTASDEEQISDFLKTLIKLEQAESATASGVDVLKGAILRLDSGGRRVNFLLPAPLAAGTQFRLTIKKDVKDLSGNDLLLGQAGEKDSSGNVVAIGPSPEEMVFWFKTRGPHGAFAAFDIRQSDSVQGGYIREIARYDNLLFVAAVDGGILAYDVSDPAALDGSDTKPLAFAPGLSTGSATAYWNVQVDHHGRIITTGMGHMFGALRTFRVEDFIAAGTPGSGAPACSSEYDNDVCSQIGGGMVSQNPGSAYTYGLHSAAVAEDRVEAIPRKVKVVIGDLPPVDYKREEFLDFATSATGPADGLQVIQAEIPANGSMYRIQRITVENVTLGLRWSADAKATTDAPDLPPAKFKNIVAGPNDTLRVTHNLTTHAVVTLFGYGIGIFDVNAFESNDRPQVSGAEKPIEQVALKANALDPPAMSTPTQISDLAYMTDGAIAAAPSGSLRVYNTDARRGVVEFATVLPSSMYLNGQTIFTPGNNARFDTLFNAVKAAGLAFPNVRFNSLALYRNTTTNKDWLLVPANDLGLFIVEAGAVPLSQNSFADVIYFPRGAYAATVIDKSNLALVVDGKGAVNLVDLSRLDERIDPATGTALDPNTLFPTAATAVSTPGTYGYGSPDPRILWRSAEGVSPGNAPPAMDPETGMFYTGELLAKKVQVGSAIDPRTRIVADYGDGKGPREVSTVVPFGIKTPDNVLKCKIADDPDNCRATLGAFRVEVMLPGSIEESMTDDLAVAIESERLPGVVAPQTPDLLPPSHVRMRRPDGSTDPRGVTGGFKLHRILDMPSVPELRYQRGWNRFISDWVVAIADPRASKQYDSSWGAADTPQEKEDLGCFSCVRPKYITDDPDAKELFTAGRFISVRPEITPSSGPYSWLGENRRLRTRASTTMADTVRPTNVLVAAQNRPIANGMLQETTYLHSGEVEVSAIDYDAGGRAGWNVFIDRTYRSRTIGLTPLGANWDSSLFRRLRALPNGDVEYRDGSEVWKFVVKNGAYEAPKGLFLKLVRYDGGWNVIDQQIRIRRFDDYGRLVAESDEFFNPADPGSGNTILYFYNGQDRLSHIVDPLDRVTTLHYNDNTGFLEKIEDWHGSPRRIDYQITDALLKKVELPDVTNTSGGRPDIEYTYESGSGYAGKLEKATNLSTITDPGESTARIDFEYNASTDQVSSQKWGTGENATFTFGSDPTTMTATDILGQSRTYKLTENSKTDPLEDRAHITQIDEQVEVWTGAASGQLPASLTPGAPGRSNTARTQKFEFDKGVLKSSEIVGLSKSSFGYTNAAGAPGLVMNSDTTTPTASASASSASVIPPATPIARTFNYQGGSGFLESIVAGGMTIQMPEAHRGEKEPDATNSSIVEKMTYDKNGLVKDVNATGGTDVSSAGAAGTIEYWPVTDAKHKRGLPHIVKDGDLQTTYDYTETQTTETDPRGVTTTTELDTWNRPTHVTIVKPGDPLVIDERYEYDAVGRVKTIIRRKGSDEVTTKYDYDLMGRRTKASTDQMATVGTVTTTATHNMTSRTIVTQRSGGATTTMELDRLGRVTRSFMNTGSSPIEVQYAYDLVGNRVFVTDMFTATATAFDAHGRAVATMDADGTIVTNEFDAWNRPKTLKAFADDGATVVAESTLNYTDAGRLTSATAKVEGAIARATNFAWDGGGRTTGVATNGRASRSTFDLSGRLETNLVGAGDVTSIGDAFLSTTVTSHDGVMPSSSTATEKGGTPLTVSSSHNVFGATTEQNLGTLIWKQAFDQLGNVTQASPPGRPMTSWDVDAEGKVEKETLPGGAENEFDYDSTGGQTNYSDPESEATSTTTDLIGRPTLRTFADGTTEVITWEGSRVKSVTDRQGRKQVYDYNGKGQLRFIRDGAGAAIDELTYDNAGRLVSWKNADSEIVWSEFNLQGLPKKTIQKRFKDGTGLGSSAVLLDQFEQTHGWNEHDERTDFSMPAYPGMTFGAGWTAAVHQNYDAMGNLIEVSRGSTLMTATYRNADRPATRTVTTSGGSTILRTYGYDAASTLLNQLSVEVNGTVVAGSAVSFDGLQRSSAQLLGVSSGNRFMEWRYDDRSRLVASVAGVPAGTDPLASAPGRAFDDLSPADFRAEQSRTSRLDAATAAELQARGIDTSRIDPPSATFEKVPGGGHKIGKVTKGPTAHSFGWNGAERVDDGRFVYEFDAKGHLIRATEKTLGAPIRRIVYFYSGTGRLVGRRAEYASVSSPTPADWKLEDRVAVVALDGLPAETTFAWDPISDNLLAVFKSGATSSDPNGGLLKQILHGGAGYDDPIETTTIDPTTGNTAHLYPVYDEAGAGSLQVVINQQGQIAARVLPNDPYGAEDVDFSGAAIDAAAVKVKKTSTGAIESVEVTLHSTEQLAEASAATGGRLAAIDANGVVVRTSSVAPSVVDEDRYTLRWSLSAAEWATLTDPASGAAGGTPVALSIGATSTLRASAWSFDVPVLPAPEWATATGTVHSSSGVPVEIREPFTSLSTFIASIGDGEEKSIKPYEVEDLTLVSVGGSSELIEDMFAARMHAHPFTDAATGLNYVRSRWYDPGTGTFLSPDPMGYGDSSNLYAFAGGDPVNGRDPSGSLCEKRKGETLWDWGKRCAEDLQTVQDEFMKGALKDTAEGALNLVTLGGYGGMKKAYQKGELDEGGMSGLIAYSKGVQDFATFGWAGRVYDGETGTEAAVNTLGSATGYTDFKEGAEIIDSAESWEDYVEGGGRILEGAGKVAGWVLAGKTAVNKIAKPAPPATPTPPATPELPAYDGKQTRGVLVTNEGRTVPLESGNAQAYQNYPTASHVEGKAAIEIRQTGSSGGTVYHNNPNGTCGYCNGGIETLLPEGAQLKVVPPKNAVANNKWARAEPTTYTGNANTPKPPKPRTPKTPKKGS